MEGYALDFIKSKGRSLMTAETHKFPRRTEVSGVLKPELVIARGFVMPERAKDKEGRP